MYYCNKCENQLKLESVTGDTIMASCEICGDPTLCKSNWQSLSKIVDAIKEVHRISEKFSEYEG